MPTHATGNDRKIEALIAKDPELCVPDGAPAKFIFKPSFAECYEILPTVEALKKFVALLSEMGSPFINPANKILPLSLSKGDYEAALAGKPGVYTFFRFDGCPKLSITVDDIVNPVSEDDFALSEEEFNNLPAKVLKELRNGSRC